MQKCTHYQEFGKGEILVLLPSNWLTSRSYQSIAQKLAASYRVIVPDLYRGLSRYKNNALTTNDYTKKLHDFLLSLEVRNYYLIGISFSGLLASEYLYQYPSELKKVMLVSTITPILSSRRKRLTLFDGFIGYIKLFFHNILSWKGVKVNLLWLFDGAFNCFIKHPRQFFLDALIATNKLGDLESKIPVPTKILIAKKDEFIPYKTFVNIKETHNFEVETIDGYHAWFFLNEKLLVEKVFDFFTK